MADAPPLYVPQTGEYCRRTFVLGASDVVNTDERTTVTINTVEEDRHGTVIEPAGAELSQYHRNPVVLITHDYDLLAAHSAVSLSDGRLVATQTDEDWDLEDPAIARWHRKLKRGLLRAASIGFMATRVERELRDPNGPDDWTNRRYRIVEWTLLEWSYVTVGSNPGALVTARMLSAGDGGSGAPGAHPAGDLGRESVPTRELDVSADTSAVPAPDDFAARLSAGIAAGLATRLSL